MLHSKKLLIILSVVAVLVLVGVGVQVYRLATVPTEQQVIEDVNAERDALNKVSVEVQKLSEEGNFSGAYELIDTKLDEAKTDTSRSELLTSKAITAMTEVNTAQSPTVSNEDAMKWAIEADDYAKTSNSAAFVASLFEGFGNKAGAVQYYTVAIDRAKTESNEISSTDGIDGGSAKPAQQKNYIEYYTSKIESLNNV